jgi:hypothetical protein
LVRHDLRRADGTNVDHVVVSPSGLYVLDSKNIGTEVRIDGDVPVALRPDGRVRYRTAKPARAARRAAAQISDALRRAGVRVWVTAVVVVWGDMPDGAVDGDRVSWVPGAALAEWLVRRPPHPDSERMARAITVVTSDEFGV